jgi:hypothetical protein
MSKEEHFPRLGLLDIYDELRAAQHFLELAAVYRFGGQESEAAESDMTSTRHWQRAGWIAEALLNDAATTVSGPPTEPTSEAQSGSAPPNETPVEAPVTDTAAPIQTEPEVWPVLRARHLAGTVDELPPIAGSLDDLPVALAPFFTTDNLKPEKVN